jgi:hypothetical protein
MSGIFRTGVGLLTVLGAVSVGIGVLGLLDSYWRYIGVALGYQPLVSGSLGFIFLMLGIGCFFAGRQAARGAVHAPGGGQDAGETEQPRPAQPR